MDRHDFIRHSLILEEMEEKKNAETKKEVETASNSNQGGWPSGVRLISADDDIEW